MEVWGDRTAVPLPAAQKDWDLLSRDVEPCWRLEHWRSKLNLETLDRRIGRPKENEWTPQKLKWADRFWAERERMQREVYRLGPVRHVFAAKFQPPFWYDSWQKAVKSAPRQQAMQQQA